MKQVSYLISWISVGLILVCLLSAIALVFVYYPNSAYESVSNLTNLPFGLFFRKLHYFSGELFLIFVLLHIIVELIRNSKEKLSKIGYISGILGLIVALILMFSGYVLKGDLNGQSAAQVAFSLISNTPILDNFISLFRDLEQFFWRFFVLHAVILPAILLYFIKIHAKKIFTNYFLVALAITIVALSFVPMPADLNPLVVTSKVSGPWFFSGGENLLILGTDPILVVSFLMTPFILLAMHAFTQKAIFANLINLALVVWVGFYAYFCFI